MDEPKPTNVSLQLTDRSITYPREILEDVLVKVDKIIFPVDFIILDMEEDYEIPFILGRPFLATGKALIDVQQGNIVLRINDEQVTFNVFKAMKFPSSSDTCFRIDAIDSVVDDKFQENKFEDLLEGCIAQSKDAQCEDEKIHESAMRMKANPPIPYYCRWQYETLEESTKKRPKPSIEEPLILELKPLLSHLKYAFLEKNDKLPIIISSALTNL